MNAAAVRRTRAGRTLSAWSAVTAVMGLVWAAGGPGFPFAGGFRAARMGAVLPDLDPLPAGLAVTALGLAGVWAADKRAVRYLGPPVAVLLLLIVPDGRLLLAVGELLVGDPGRVEAAAPAQAWFAAGGVLWAWPAGRRLRRPGDAEPVVRARPVTLLAAALPFGYAIPRALWAAGHPFGLDAATTAMVSSPSGRLRELVFSIAAATGGLLTLGLTQRWGTRLFGVPVPRMLAVVPATVVSVLLTASGVTMWRALAGFDPANWAAWAGNLVWLPWGVTLGLATRAYHRRRRSGEAGLAGQDRRLYA